MIYAPFSRFYSAVLVSIVVLCLVTPWVGVAQNGPASLSGRVVDTNGNPVEGLNLAVKPVEINMGQEIGPLAPFASWPRGRTDADGNFSIANIDPVSSRLGDVSRTRCAFRDCIRSHRGSHLQL